MSKYKFAVVDADGYYGNNKTVVYSRHQTREAALKASRSPSLQAIEGEFAIRGIVYGDTIGRIYPRVS